MWTCSITKLRATSPRTRPPASASRASRAVAPAAGVDAAELLDALENEAVEEAEPDFDGGTAPE